MMVNWIGFQILDAKGQVKYAMAGVTSLPVSKDNDRRHRRLWPRQVEN